MNGKKSVHVGAIQLLGAGGRGERLDDSEHQLFYRLYASFSHILVGSMSPC